MGMYVEIYMHFICGQVFSMYDKKMGFFPWVDGLRIGHVCRMYVIRRRYRGGARGVVIFEKTGLI